MRADYALVGQFVVELHETASLEGRFSLYERFILAMGFEGATYTFIPNIQLNTRFSTPPVFAHTVDYPMAFLEQYTTERLDRHDFTIRKARTNRWRALDWREHEVQQQVSPKELKIIQLARAEYNIRNALTIPTLTGHTGVAGASIISSEKDPLFELLKKEKLDTLCHITKSFHDCLFSEQQLSQEFLRPFLNSLTPKEIFILRHLSSGKHLKQLDDKVASYRVASNIIERLRGKFGDVTRDQLMFMIGMLRLLDQD
jgi:DNA-binding CsgD family transcriptional regulator